VLKLKQLLLCLDFQNPVKTGAGEALILFSSKTYLL